MKGGKSVHWLHWAERASQHRQQALAQEHLVSKLAKDQADVQLASSRDEQDQFTADWRARLARPEAWFSMANAYQAYHLFLQERTASHAEEQRAAQATLDAQAAALRVQVVRSQALARVVAQRQLQQVREAQAQQLKLDSETFATRHHRKAPK